MLCDVRYEQALTLRPQIPSLKAMCQFTPSLASMQSKYVYSAFYFHTYIYMTLDFHFFIGILLFQLDKQICHSHLSVYCGLWDSFPYG